MRDPSLSLDAASGCSHWPTCRLPRTRIMSIILCAAAMFVVGGAEQGHGRGVAVSFRVCDVASSAHGRGNFDGSIQPRSLNIILTFSVHFYVLQGFYFLDFRRDRNSVILIIRLYNIIFISVSLSSINTSAPSSCRHHMTVNATKRCRRILIILFSPGPWMMIDIHAWLNNHLPN